MSAINQTEAYLSKLANLIEPIDVLEKHGYIFKPLAEEELLLKRRCLGCGEAMSKFVERRARKRPNSAQTIIESPSLQDMLAAGITDLSLTAPNAKPVRTVEEPKFECNYHPGEVSQNQLRQKFWTCCNQLLPAKPCVGFKTHQPKTYAPGMLTWLYQCHPTPSTPCRGADIRAAVALDCEMGIALSGDSELIRVTMVDYFTSEILVDNLVETDVAMSSLNTRYSGVTWADMRQAQMAGTCLQGKEGARKAIWRFVGPQTVVVGHAASNDLRALKWIHGLVVDSLVTELIKKKDAEDRKKEAEAEKMGEAEIIVADHITGDLLPGKERNRGPRKRPLALKTLVKERLQRDIQMGKSGHDSLEDAIAARDLVHWIVTHPGGK